MTWRNFSNDLSLDDFICDFSRTPLGDRPFRVLRLFTGQCFYLATLVCRDLLGPAALAGAGDIAEQPAGRQFLRAAAIVPGLAVAEPAARWGAATGPGDGPLAG